LTPGKYVFEILNGTPFVSIPGGYDGGIAYETLNPSADRDLKFEVYADNVVSPTPLIPSVPFENNKPVYFKLTVTVTEESYDPVVKSENTVSNAMFYARPVLGVQTDALFDKNELSKIIVDFNAVKYVNDDPSDDPASKFKFKLTERATELLASPSVVKYVPDPVLIDVKNYTYQLNYTSAMYLNNPVIEQQVSIIPDPLDNYDSIRFSAKDLVVGSKATPRARVSGGNFLPASTETNKVVGDIYVGSNKVSEFDFFTGAYTVPLESDVDHSISLYRIVNGIQSTKVMPPVSAGKYFAPPTVTLASNLSFMHSSMAHQPSPVGGSDLETAMNLTNCVDMGGATGTVTIVPSTPSTVSVYKGTLDTSKVGSYSGDNYIIVYVAQYSNGGHEVTVASVTTNRGIPNLRNMTQLNLPNLWNGPVSFVNDNTGTPNTPNYTFKITTPTPLNLADATYLQNGQAYMRQFDVVSGASYYLPGPQIVVPNYVTPSKVTKFVLSPGEIEYAYLDPYDATLGRYQLYLDTRIATSSITNLKLFDLFDGQVTYIATGGWVTYWMYTPLLNFSSYSSYARTSEGRTFLRVSGASETVYQNPLPANVIQTLPNMATGMGLDVSVVTEMYPHPATATITNIPLYTATATVYATSLNQEENPRAPELFNTDRTTFQVECFISDVKDCLTLAFSLNNGSRTTIPTPGQSEVFWTSPIPVTSSTQTFRIHVLYPNCAFAIDLYQKVIQTSFPPMIEHDFATKTGKIYGVSSAIDSISLLDSNGNTYTMNHILFTKVNNFLYTYNFNQTFGNFDGWIMSAKSSSGASENMNGTFYQGLHQIDNFTGKYIGYVTELEYGVLNNLKVLSIKTSESSSFTGIKVRNAQGALLSLPSDSYKNRLLLENELSTQYELEVNKGMVVGFILPAWLLALIQNQTSSGPYGSYEEFIVNKNADLSSVFSVDFLQLDTCKFKTGAFNGTAQKVVSSAPGIKTELFNTTYKFSKTNVNDKRVTLAHEGFFFD